MYENEAEDVMTVDDFAELQSSIISEYADYGNEVELFLADPSYEDRAKVEELQEIVDNNWFSYDHRLVKDNALDDFLTEKISEAEDISAILEKKNRGIWPYTLIEFDIEQASEDIRASAETVEFDGDTFYAVEA